MHVGAQRENPCSYDHLTALSLALTLEMLSTAHSPWINDRKGLYRGEMVSNRMHARVRLLPTVRWTAPRSILTHASFAARRIDGEGTREPPWTQVVHSASRQVGMPCENS